MDGSCPQPGKGLSPDTDHAGTWILDSLQGTSWNHNISGPTARKLPSTRHSLSSCLPPPCLLCMRRSRHTLHGPKVSSDCRPSLWVRSGQYWIIPLASRLLPMENTSVISVPSTVSTPNAFPWLHLSCPAHRALISVDYPTFQLEDPGNS